MVERQVASSRIFCLETPSMAPQSIWPWVFRSGKRASRSRRAVVLGFAGADLGVQARLLSKGAADLLALGEKLGRRIDSHGESLQQTEALTLCVDRPPATGVGLGHRKPGGRDTRVQRRKSIGGGRVSGHPERARRSRGTERGPRGVGSLNGSSTINPAISAVGVSRKAVQIGCGCSLPSNEPDRGCR